MALATVGWYDDGRFRNTFPSEIFVAPGRIRHADGTYEIQAFVTNQDSQAWIISGENGGVITYRLSTDPIDTRKTAISLDVAAGELVILYAPAHTTPAGIGGFLTVNVVPNPCGLAVTDIERQLRVIEGLQTLIDSVTDNDADSISRTDVLRLRAFGVGVETSIREIRRLLGS